MNKLNIKMDDGTQIDDFQDLKDVLEELRDDIRNKIAVLCENDPIVEYE